MSFEGIITEFHEFQSDTLRKVSNVSEAAMQRPEGAASSQPRASPWVQMIMVYRPDRAKAFISTPQNITMHIGNAYKEGELARDSTCKEYLQVQQEGKRKVSRKVKYYDLDVIISVGYRVKSKRGGFTLEELSPVTCQLSTK